MSYQPTADDFEEPAGQNGYRPSVNDFEDEPIEDDKLKQSLMRNRQNLAKEQASYRDESGHEGSKGFKGIASDVIKGLSNALKSGKSFLGELGEEAPAAFKMFGEQPGRAFSNVASGAAEIGKGIINAPHDIMKYAAKKELLPDAINAGYEAIADIVPHIPEDTGAAKYLGLDKKQKGDRLLQAIPNIAAAGTAVAQIPSGIKATKNLFNKAGTKLAEAEKAENALKRSLEKAKEGTSESQFSAANQLNEQKQNLMKTHAEKSAEVESMIPNLPGREVRSQNVNYVSEARQQLKDHFDQRYNDYRSGAGAKPISEPYTREQLEPMLSQLNPAGKRMAEGVMPQEVKLDIINPENGKAFVLNIPAENASVQDYIELMRTARDARSKIKRDIKNKNLTRADELEMSAQAESLQNLREDAERRIKSSVTPEEYEQFQNIQNDYGHLYRPFMDNNDLFNAWFDKKDSGKIFDQLTQPKYAKLYHELSSDPSFKQLALSNALRGKAHPLSHKDPVAQAKKINELLEPHNADITEHMSNEQFAALKQQAALGETIGAVNKGIESLSNSLLQKAKKEYDLAKARKLNPEGEKLLKDIEDKQLTKEDINKRMKEAGITTEEAKSAFHAKQQAYKMWKQALAIVGAGKIVNHL